MDALAATPRTRLAGPRRWSRLRSDAALAERFAEGDEAAFAILFERHRASVIAVCVGVLGSRHDAEDAAQETFAALAVALRSSPPRELRAWLTRVARNAAIDLARRRRTRESVNDELGEVGGPDGVSASQVVKHEFESVIAGIRELPESQRTALLMRELAGHTYREIAELLETDEDAVRGLIARARVGLRQYREAAELPCATAREAIAEEPDGRRHDRTIRRHVRGCASCRAYRSALRDDARALRGLLPVPAGGAAGGGAVVGLAAKAALLGTAATQVTAACAVSVCAVGGIALIAPTLTAHHHRSANVIVHRASVRRTSSLSSRGATAAAPSAAHAAFPGRSASVRHSTASTPISTRSRARNRLGSERGSTTNGSSAQRSVTAPGRFTVPAGGRPSDTSQQSGGRDPSSTGRGPGPGSAGLPSGGSPAGSGSSGPEGPRPGGTAQTSRQGSGAPPPSSPLLGGATGNWSSRPVVAGGMSASGRPAGANDGAPGAADDGAAPRHGGDGLGGVGPGGQTSGEPDGAQGSSTSAPAS